jgi:hypothetical protein
MKKIITIFLLFFVSILPIFADTHSKKHSETVENYKVKIKEKYLEKIL